MSLADLIKLIAELLQSWPFVLLIMVVVLKRQIGIVMRALSGRIRRGGVEIRYGDDKVLKFPEIREPQ